MLNDPEQLEDEMESQWKRPKLVMAAEPHHIPTSAGKFFGIVGYAKLSIGFPVWFGSIFTSIEEPDSGNNFLGAGMIALPACQVRFDSRSRGLTPYPLNPDIRFADRIRPFADAHKTYELMGNLGEDWGWRRYTNWKALKTGENLPTSVVSLDFDSRFREVACPVEIVMFETMFGSPVEYEQGLKMFPHQVVRTKVFPLSDFTRLRTIEQGVSKARCMIYALDEAIVTRQAAISDGLLDDNWIPDPPTK